MAIIRSKALPLDKAITQSPRKGGDWWRSSQEKSRPGHSHLGSLLTVAPEIITLRFQESPPNSRWCSDHLNLLQDHPCHTILCCEGDAREPSRLREILNWRDSPSSWGASPTIAPGTESPVSGSHRKARHWGWWPRLERQGRLQGAAKGLKQGFAPLCPEPGQLTGAAQGSGTWGLECRPWGPGLRTLSYQHYKHVEVLEQGLGHTWQKVEKWDWSGGPWINPKERCQ